MNTNQFPSSYSAVRQRQQKLQQYQITIGTLTETNTNLQDIITKQDEIIQQLVLQLSSYQKRDQRRKKQERSTGWFRNNTYNHQESHNSYNRHQKDHYRPQSHSSSFYHHRSMYSKEDHDSRSSYGSSILNSYSYDEDD